MKIAFDLYGAEPAKNGVINHGGGEYVKVVFDYVYKNRGKNSLYAIVSGKDSNILSFLKQYDVNVLRCKDSKDFQSTLDNELFDTLYCGLYVGQYKGIVIPKNTRFILTEHGLRGIEVKFDKYFLATEKNKNMNFIKMMFSKILPNLYLKLKIKKYAHEFEIKKEMIVVTVSNHSKYAIRYYYPNVQNIIVGYSPMKISCSKTNIDLLNKIGLEKGKYILMINANRGEKNCLRALLALDDLVKKSLISKDISIVLTGVTYDKVFKKFKNINMIKLGYVNSITLETLYANAFLFLYPTINEGFGYPPLEAMKYNTMVAASAICSVPEVCGDSVLYFNPYDIKEIENRILQSFDSNIRELYISKMQNRLRYINDMQEKGLVMLTKYILGD